MTEIIELGTGTGTVNEEVYDAYLQLTKDRFMSTEQDLIDAYIAVETLGAVLARALGIPRIEAIMEDGDE